jgi:nucleoside-diphosphate-sugar epimerase
MKIILTGGSGLVGGHFLNKISIDSKKYNLNCLVRVNSNREYIEEIRKKNLIQIDYIVGDSSQSQCWDLILKSCPDVIVHIASITHLHVILDKLKQNNQSPRLIIIGTTGIYSKYRQSAETYQKNEQLLRGYTGSYCLLRPTMIYGSHRDKNLHKLIKFCDRYGFFPVFGAGENLVQPVHAEDLAQTLLTALQNPHIQGAYDLSGGTVVNFRELLTLVGKLLDKPVRQISLPLNAGVWSATILENLLKERSPVRREQILRLQEDKAYPHDAAQRDLDFFPRTLEEGLRQEVELMRSLGMISS